MSESPWIFKNLIWDFMNICCFVFSWNPLSHSLTNIYVIELAWKFFVLKIPQIFCKKLFLCCVKVYYKNLKKIEWKFFARKQKFFENFLENKNNYKIFCENIILETFFLCYMEILNFYIVLDLTFKVNGGIVITSYE